MAYVTTGTVRSDEQGRVARVVKVWRVDTLGVCVRAAMNSGDSEDTREHTYMGSLVSFLKTFPVGSNG